MSDLGPGRCDSFEFEPRGMVDVKYKGPVEVFFVNRRPWKSSPYEIAAAANASSGPDP